MKPDESLKNDSETENDYDEMDWDALDALTDDDIDAAVARDPDAQLLTEEDGASALAAPNVKEIRASFPSMSQTRFAREFRLSRRSVQEWEQGRKVPNRGFWLYLTAIRDPYDLVKRVERLRGESPSPSDMTPARGDMIQTAWEESASARKPYISTSGLPLDSIGIPSNGRIDTGLGAYGG